MKRLLTLLSFMVLPLYAMEKIQPERIIVCSLFRDAYARAPETSWRYRVALENEMVWMQRNTRFNALGLTRRLVQINTALAKHSKDMTNEEYIELECEKMDIRNWLRSELITESLAIFRRVHFRFGESPV